MFICTCDAQTLPDSWSFSKENAPRSNSLGFLGVTAIANFCSKGQIKALWSYVIHNSSQHVCHSLSLHSKLMLGMPRNSCFVEGLETVKCGKPWKTMGQSPKTFNFIYERNAMKLPSMCTVQCGGMEAKAPRKWRHQVFFCMRRVMNITISHNQPSASLHT